MLAGAALSVVASALGARTPLIQANGSGSATAALPLSQTPLQRTSSLAPRIPAGIAGLRVPELRLPWGRWLSAAAGAVLAVMGLLAVATAGMSFAAGHGGSSRATAEMYGPPTELRAGTGFAGELEQGYALSSPSASDLGAAAMAAVQERHDLEVVRALLSLSEQMKAKEAAAAAQRSHAARAQAPSAGPATSLGRASGYAAGTVLNARITIYGCTGPGGGFCGNMSTGVKVFEGAAACSRDLPFGTRFIIHGDPTGRVYECMDRGALRATWVDIFFYNTSQGMSWASALGGTVAPIEIVN
jgi:hypothetical protein